jgi:hypothetical protein
VAFYRTRIWYVTEANGFVLLIFRAILSSDRYTARWSLGIRFGLFRRGPEKLFPTNPAEFGLGRIQSTASWVTAPDRFRTLFSKRSKDGLLHHGFLSLRVRDGRLQMGYLSNSWMLRGYPAWSRDNISARLIIRVTEIHCPARAKGVYFG